VGVFLSQKYAMRESHRRRKRSAIARYAEGDNEYGLPTKLMRTVKAMQALPSDKIRYQQILALARKLPPMSDDQKTETNKVPGCLSTVHVSASLSNDGTVQLAGDSDAIMSKGLVALLILGLNGCTPEQVQKVEPEFIKACGITASLTPGRNNGFFNMLQLIKKKVADMAVSGQADSMDDAPKADAQPDKPAPLDNSMRVYNTLSRQKETFQTEVDGIVNMYVCGMTVYDLCHLGHARIMVFFDLVAKFLECEGYEVKYVRNITDVDDKIIRRAKELGEEPQELADRMALEMQKDAASLGCRRPTVEPKATEHIEEIVNFIGKLVNKGHAYEGPEQPDLPSAPRDVYFRLKSFPSYGRLSRCSLEGNQAGARVEVVAGKEAAEDFALWKAAKAEEPFWQAPWGPGRPGWHIECSAMAKKHLGETLDIHGGGPDLIFPHHENEIAQSEALHGGRTYARTWMHCASVRSAGGDKMSKSLGNFVTIRDVLKNYDGEILRFYLLGSQYRQPLLYTEDSLSTAEERLLRFYNALRGVPDSNKTEWREKSGEWSRFMTALRNDFDTVSAISCMSDVSRQLINAKGQDTGNSGQPQHAQELASMLRAMGAMLGVLQRDPLVVLRGGSRAANEALQVDRVEALVAERNEARRSRDFKRADAIRDELSEMGIVLEDTPGATTWRVGVAVASAS